MGNQRKFVTFGLLGVLFVGLLVCVSLILDKNDTVEQLNAELTSLKTTAKAEEDLADNSIDKDAYQAVFLQGGQVYFGKIDETDDDTINLENVYYLRTGGSLQQSSSSNVNGDVSLVKLGCELHGPQDKMVINRDQVIFLENLKDDSQAVKAINAYRQQNPNGQRCE